MDIAELEMIGVDCLQSPSWFCLELAFCRLGKTMSSYAFG